MKLKKSFTDSLPHLIHTGLYLETPSNIAKTSVKPIAIQRHSKTFDFGDFTCFQNNTCVSNVKTIPKSDIEHPIFDIYSKISRSVSVSYKHDKVKFHLLPFSQT